MKMIVKKMNGDVNIAIEHSQPHSVAGFTRNPVNKRILLNRQSNLVPATDVAIQVIILQIAMRPGIKKGMS
jgi:hypothetical protein